MSAPVAMVVDVTNALTKHGVKWLDQQHMNRLLDLLGEMIEFSKDVEEGRHAPDR